MWSFVISCGIFCPFVFNPVRDVGGRAVDAAPLRLHLVSQNGLRAGVAPPTVGATEIAFFAHDLRPLFTSSYQLRLPVLDECLRITPAAI